MALIEIAQNIEPRDVDMIIVKALIYADMGKFTRASRACDEAIDMEPEYDRVYRVKGIVLAKAGENDEALKCFSIAIKVNEFSYINYLERGNFFVTIKKYQKGINDFTEAISLHKAINAIPKTPKPDLARAKAYIAIKDIKKAKTDIQTCQKFGWNVSPEILKAVGLEKMQKPKVPH